MSEPPPATVPAGIPAVEASTTGAVLDQPQVIVITGMSGAGRTRAAAVLEDLGWYVVDNLPAQMLVHLVGMLTAGTAGDRAQRLGAVIDVRGGEFFGHLDEALDEVEESGVDLRVLFLDASDETLVRRFEQVRRPHPLQGEGRVLDAIGEERRLLAPVRERADVVVDTAAAVAAAAAVASAAVSRSAECSVLPTPWRAALTARALPITARAAPTASKLRLVWPAADAIVAAIVVIAEARASRISPRMRRWRVPSALPRKPTKNTKH